MANINKYITAGFIFNWKSIPLVKELSDEYGIDLENVELIVNGLKDAQNKYTINIYARVTDSDNLTHIHKSENIDEVDINKANGIANYYSTLVQRVAKSTDVDWVAVYDEILNSDFSDDDFDWDSLDDIITEE